MVARRREAPAEYLTLVHDAMLDAPPMTEEEREAAEAEARAAIEAEFDALYAQLAWEREQASTMDLYDMQSETAPPF